MFISSSNIPNTAPILDHATDCVTKVLCELAKSYQSQIDKANARLADEGFPVLQKIENCTAFDNIYGPGNYLKPDSHWMTRERTPEELKTFYTKLLDDARLKLEEQHSANVPAIESNKKLQEKLNALFLSLGFTTTIRVRDYNSRARFPKYVEQPSGWHTTVTQSIQTYDGYQGQLDAEKRLREELTKYIAEMEKKIAAAKDAEEKKKQEEKKNRALGVILARYGLDSDATAEDALDVVIGNNKYLHLAHHLQMNRNDWSDGYGFAVVGLRFFTIENDEDALIHDDIQRIISNDDVDGRYFRDTKYGYNFLFAKSFEQNPVLHKDYLALSEMVSR